MKIPCKSVQKFLGKVANRQKTNRQTMTVTMHILLGGGNNNNSNNAFIFGRPTVCKIVRPMLSYRCPVCLSVCDVGVLWPNGWMDQDETWRGDRPRPQPDCVRWGPSSPQKGPQQPFRFWLMFVVAKPLDGSKMPIGTEVDLGPGDIVLDGDPAPPPPTAMHLL